MSGDEDINDSNFVENSLQYGCTVNPEDVNNSKLLHDTVQKGDLKVVEQLLKYGTDVNKLYRGATPLHAAVINNQEEMAMLLIRYGADVNAQDESAKVPLFHAIRNIDLKSVEFLLEHGADVNASDRNGNTVLHFISEDEYFIDDNDRGKIVKLLISRGANVNAQTKEGIKPLDAAIDRASVDVVEALLEYNADVNSIVNDRLPPLHLAARESNEIITKMLVEHGADLNITSRNKQTALHIASLFGHAEVVETLLQYGALIDSKDADGRTALHIASRIRQEQTVITLLEHGADINIISSDNETPLDAAIGNSHSLNNRVSEIFTNHIIKIKAANLYLNQKNLLSINNNDFQNKCEKEIANMKSEKIGNSIISFYDVLTTSIHQVAIILENENIVQILRSDDYKIKFPLYASMINNQYRKGKRKNELLKQVNKYSYNIFPRLPIELIPKILSYVSDEDLHSLGSACRPADVDEEIASSLSKVKLSDKKSSRLY